LSSIVIDASVALAWCFPDEASAYAETVLVALEGHEILVPSLWPIEITNALLVAERRKRIKQSEVHRFVELLAGLTVVIASQSVTESVNSILPLAREYALSAYDAAYLDLALQHGAPLSTLDHNLQKAGAMPASRFSPGAKEESEADSENLHGNQSVASPTYSFSKE
jgi:predicted nucleic acid-binding protein